MKYTVLWTATAERDLAELWLQANDREAVRSAADALDSLLRDDPHERGESRGDSVRVILLAPLGIDVEISQADRCARVLRVWRYGPSA